MVEIVYEIGQSRMSFFRFSEFVDCNFRISKRTIKCVLVNLIISSDFYRMKKSDVRSGRKMKTYYARKGKGLEGLTLKEHEIGQPGYGEILIEVKATALNFRELMIIMSGTYPLPVRDPFVPVADGAGEVVAIGEGVTSVKIDDRVAGVVFPQWADGLFSLEFSQQLGGSLDGMLTEYKLLPEHAVVSVPAHLTWEEAATFPCAGVTAWNALTGGRPLMAGETVLTLGTGGVSLFALQFAKLFGARVIATTSSDEKAARLKQLGADNVINYRTTTDWDVAVREITGGHGADHIIEVGGAGTLEKSLKAMHLTGEVSLVGWLSNDKPLIDINILASTVGSIRRIALGSRAHNIAMNRAVDTAKLRPVVDKIFHFTEAKEAFKYYAAGKYFGKVVIANS